MQDNIYKPSHILGDKPPPHLHPLLTRGTPLDTAVCRYNHYMVKEGQVCGTIVIETWKDDREPAKYTYDKIMNSCHNCTGLFENSRRKTRKQQTFFLTFIFFILILYILRSEFVHNSIHLQYTNVATTTAYSLSSTNHMWTFLIYIN